MSRKDKLTRLIQKAMNTKQAETAWDLGDIDLERRPLDQREHPGAAAILLVREAMAQFEIPSEVSLTYKGMRRASGHGQHHLTDGLIEVNADFRSISGTKHHVNVPVIVHGGYMVFPEVFQHEGQTHVMAQSAFDEILKRGNVYQKMQDRKNMYSPHLEERSSPAPVPAVGNGLFGVHASSKQADHTPHGLDPAERDHSRQHQPGDKVKLSNEIQARLRGGSRIVYTAGTEVTVIRDMAGDGYTYYCEFPDRRRAPVHYADLADA
jgi:hypothetical protein